MTPACLRPQSRWCAAPAPLLCLAELPAASVPAHELRVGRRNSIRLSRGIPMRRCAQNGNRHRLGGVCPLLAPSRSAA
eukprot:2389491-Heterocapsa_arctica.AAC.1